MISSNQFKKGDERTIRLAKKAGKASFLAVGSEGMRERGAKGLAKRWGNKNIKLNKSLGVNK